MRPFVSAIVTAYNRDTYLGEALDSACSQDVDADRYEVILLSNLVNDSQIAADVSARHPAAPPVRVVRSHESRKGRFFGDGVRAAYGEIVCFLNDDDRWDSRRVRFVDDAFTQDRELGFLRNAVRCIDEYGKPSDRLAGFRRLVRSESDETNRYLSGEHLLREVGTRFADFGFNDSAISIRRSLLVERLRFFDQITASEDSFLFYSAMLSGLPLRFDSNPLTDYRVSARDSPRLGRDARPFELLRSLNRETLRQIETFEIIQRMIENSNQLNFRRPIDRDLAYLNLLNRIQDPTPRIDAIARATFGLALRLNAWNLAASIALTGIGLMGCLSPRLAQSAYLRAGSA